MPAAKADTKPKLGTVIAEAIEADIISSGWPVGSVLATEAELIARFGVSRATVREAISQLERRGIAAMRAGKKGGLIVSAPARDAAIRALATYMELANTNVEDILRVRLMLEQQAANLAAERITDEEARALRAHVKQLDLRTGRLDDDSKAHLEIRRLIAAASHNPVLLLFIEALSISAIDVIRTHIELTESVRDTIEQTSRIKADLVEAIIGYDKFNAQRLTREDVELQIEGFKQYQLNALSAPPSNWNGTNIKLPQSVAMKISEHIADHKLQEGDRLGSEPDLQKQFGVSRSVLREAIRMLESYSVVTMRRGFGGGLTVGKPDPGPTISSAVRFLRSMGIEWRHLFEIREVLELAAVGLAARNASADQLARLRDAFHAEMTLLPDINPVPVMTNVHKLISETGGNSVLSLITKVVIESTAASYTQPPSRDMARRVLESHHAIILAIVDRDENMARRRIFNHLLMLGTIGYDLSRVFGEGDDFSSVLKAATDVPPLRL